MTAESSGERMSRKGVLSYVIDAGLLSASVMMLTAVPAPVEGSPSPTAIVISLSSATTMVGTAVTVSSTLIGVTANAGGQVYYEYFVGASCSGWPSVISVVTVTNGVAPSSRPIVFNAAGYYSWKGVYSGDKNNMPSTSSCVLLTVRTTTQVSVLCAKTFLLVGNSTTCTAAVYHGAPPYTGTITWTKASGTGTGKFSSSTCTLSSGKCSVTFTATGKGGLLIRATYSGNTFNVGSSGTLTLSVG
ncbi:MAG: hypothetical protein HY296_01430 [Thaumarchaeota archaeon]|nr:hypothetical protein [Nitrososphaerota archaeon]